MPDDTTDSETIAEELRTIGFRMREIQRLLNVRVKQENRKLEADGIEPVDDTSFREALSPEE